MMNKIIRKIFSKKLLFLPLAFPAMIIINLALTPHYTCGCGDQKVDGTELGAAFDSFVNMIQSMF